MLNAREILHAQQNKQYIISTALTAGYQALQLLTPTQTNAISYLCFSVELKLFGNSFSAFLSLDFLYFLI